jgi:outer membrane protein OmpA-like peptidoglycan-associated protein
MQADLICQGRFTELREWQLSELQRLSVRTTVDDPGIAERSVHFLASTKYPIAMSIALLLLALVSHYYIERSGKCGPEIVFIEPPTPPPAVLTLNADELFAYDKSDIRPELRQKIKSDLIAFFKDYHDITFNSIKAHTDPIHTVDYNRSLAAARAQEVRGLLSEVANDKTIHDKLKDGFSPTMGGGGPGNDTADHDIWNACFDEYYIGNAKHPIRSGERPLQDLKDGTRTLCSKSGPVGEGGTYPACQHDSLPRAKATAEQTARTADNFRAMVECLAPMRHVVVTYEAVHNNIDGSK